MPTFVAAKCPNCGGDLQIPTDRDAVKCMYCSGDVIVRQAINASAGGNVQNWMHLAHAAADAGNNEEVLTNVNKVLEVDPSNSDAWFLKGVATGWQSSLLDCRLGEMASIMSHAVDFAPASDKEDIRQAAALMINEATVAYYDLCSKHLMEFVTVDSAWPDFLPQAIAALDSWHAAHEINPENQVILTNLIRCATELLNGIAYNDTDRYGRYERKVHTISANFAETLSEARQECVVKLQALDPSYSPPPIKVAKVGASQTILNVMRLFGSKY